MSFSKTYFYVLSPQDLLGPVYALLEARTASYSSVYRWDNINKLGNALSKLGHS